MKLMKKFMKKSEGFTLVELIVVIAILAILAGVAVPAYSAYISKAEAVQDDALIASLETGLNSAGAMNGKMYPVVQIVIDAGEATFTFEATDDAVASDFADFVDGDYTNNDNAGDTVVVDGFKYATALKYENGQLTITAPAN